MRLINKRKRAPRPWRTYAADTKATFDAASSEAKNALRLALYEEQGGLCAYCMCELPSEIVQGTPQPLQGKTVIEHIQPQSLYPELALNYDNLVLCCQGQAGGGVRHCDASKSNTEMTISPLKNHCMQTIEYGFKQGLVKSSGEGFDKDINDTLKLNDVLLKRKRQAVYDSLIKLWEKNPSVDDLERAQKKWSQLEKGRYRAYCGVAIALLDRWIRKKRKS